MVSVTSNGSVSKTSKNLLSPVSTLLQNLLDRILPSKSHSRTKPDPFKVLYNQISTSFAIPFSKFSVELYKYSYQLNRHNDLTSKSFNSWKSFKNFGHPPS